MTASAYRPSDKTSKISNHHKVGLAARSDLDSDDSLSGVLTSRVEGAARVLTLVELPIFTLDNFGNDH
jgi:hypothetical protein